MTEETVRRGRDLYLAENSLTLESYTAKRFPVYVWKWPIYLPNPGLLHLHDLHHVVTGYGTGLLGEAEISAYELRGGCPSAIIFILCIGALFIGIFVSPKRIRQAWRQAKGSRTLYDTKIAYEELLEMSVADLRERLGIKHGGWKQNTEQL